MLQFDVVYLEYLPQIGQVKLQGTQPLQMLLRPVASGVIDVSVAGEEL